MHTALNNAKKSIANIASEVWVRVIAERTTAIIRNDLSKSSLITAQKNNRRNDWDNNDGQWPHKNPVETGWEKIINDNGNESKAAVLLKFFIMKYMIKLPIMAKNTTVIRIES